MLIIIKKYFYINIKNFINNKIIYCLNSKNLSKILILLYNNINIIKKLIWFNNLINLVKLFIIYLILALVNRNIF